MANKQNFFKRIFQFFINPQESSTTPSTNQPDNKSSDRNVYYTQLIDLLRDQARDDIRHRQKLDFNSSKTRVSDSFSQRSIRSQIVQPSQIDDLSSDRNVDYTLLRDLLAAKNWKDADIETNKVMFEVISNGFFDWIMGSKLN